VRAVREMTEDLTLEELRTALLYVGGPMSMDLTVAVRAVRLSRGDGLTPLEALHREPDDDQPSWRVGG
jgi:hypothetical protein